GRSGDDQAVGFEQIEEPPVHVGLEIEDPRDRALVQYGIVQGMISDVLSFRTRHTDLQHLAAVLPMLPIHDLFESAVELASRDGRKETQAAEVHRQNRHIQCAGMASSSQQSPVAAEYHDELASCHQFAPGHNWRLQLGY